MAENQSDYKNITGDIGFAVTLLAALGSALYAAYNYFQNVAIDINTYRSVCGLISVAIILIVGLFIYLLIKGYSIEVHNKEDKEILNRVASEVYLSIYLIFILSFILLIRFFSIGDVRLDDSFIILSMGVVIFFSWPKSTTDFLKFIIKYITNIRYRYILNHNNISTHIKHVGEKARVVLSRKPYDWITQQLPSLDDINNKVWYAFQIVVIASFVFYLLFIIVPNVPILQGNIAVNMESIYYKNDTMIPVSISITGPNAGISVELFKVESNNLTSLALIDHLNPQPNRKIISNNSLVGSALGSGKYSIFINTTNLDSGYYELRCLRQEYEKMDIASFYILNSN